MSNLRFTSTKLQGSGKQGLLTPDENGYYTTVVGGLNVLNSAGEYYLADGARELFKASSIFMRRVTSGCLKGESGHPKRLPGMSLEQYLNRILTIDEANVIAHFSEIWLDEEYGKRNPDLGNKDLIAIMAKVKPAGPKFESLKQSFENPKEEVCFSIRALTRDFYQSGKTFRVLQQIVTFDHVVEPGISIARKWHSPSLESLTEQTIKSKDIELITKEESLSLATESTKQLALEALDLVKSDPSYKIVNLPILSKW